MFCCKKLKMSKKVRFSSTRQFKYFDLSAREKRDKIENAINCRIIEKLRKITDKCIYLHENRRIRNDQRMKIIGCIKKWATQLVKNIDLKLGNRNWRGYGVFTFANVTPALNRLAMGSNSGISEETRELLIHIAREMAFCTMICL